MQILLFVFIGLVPFIKAEASNYTCQPRSIALSKYEAMRICVYCDDSIDRLLTEAEQFCSNLTRGMGGYSSLITSHDEKYDAWLTNTHSGKRFWLSLTDAVVNGKYYWADGESYTSLDAWKSDQPKDEPDKRCIKVKSKVWEREPCDSEMKYVCQYVMFPNETNCDLGYRGMLSPRLCLYLELNNKKMFEDAEKHCQSKAGIHVGHLLKADNPSNFETLDADINDYWIGLNDRNSFKTFYWTDGTFSGYPPWSVRLANQRSDTDNCYYWDNGDWMRGRCDDKKKACCQVKFPICSMMAFAKAVQTYRLKKTSQKTSMGYMIEYNLDLQRCAHACIANRNCGSFNFDANNKICQLNSYCERELVPSNDFDYYE